MMMMMEQFEQVKDNDKIIVKSKSRDIIHKIEKAFILNRKQKGFCAEISDDWWKKSDLDAPE